VIPISRTLKKSVGVLIALTTSQAMTRTTKTTPRIERSAGRLRLRNAEGAGGDAVGAAAAIAGF
jgi:hypothetical protein